MSRLLPALVCPIPDEFTPKCLEKRFGYGVVVRVSGSRRGLLDLMGARGLWNAPDNNVRLSCDRTGNNHGNAAAEPSFATLRNEVYYRETLATSDVARVAVIELVESHNNRRRFHSSIDYGILGEAMDAFFERMKPVEKATAMAT